MFGTLRENSSLKSVLKDIIDETQMKDAITKEVLLTSWDFNNRMPYIFTKKNIHLTEDKMKKYNLLEATFLSACNPLYFNPCKGPEKDTN